MAEVCTEEQRGHVKKTTANAVDGSDTRQRRGGGLRSEHDPRYESRRDALDEVKVHLAVAQRTENDIMTCTIA
jgi:hypothetical protein